MSLADVLARLLVDKPAWVELTSRGEPSSPAVTVSGWIRRGPMLSASVSFGPYTGPVTFDSARLHVDGGYDDLPFGETTRLAPGLTFVYDLAVRIG